MDGEVKTTKTYQLSPSSKPILLDLLSLLLVLLLALRQRLLSQRSCKEQKIRSYKSADEFKSQAEAKALVHLPGQRFGFAGCCWLAAAPRSAPGPAPEPESRWRKAACGAEWEREDIFVKHVKNGKSPSLKVSWRLFTWVMLCLQDWYNFWRPLENSISGKTEDLLWLCDLSQCRRAVSPLTQRSSLFHVAYQVLHVLGSAFGIKKSWIHPSLTVLKDHIHFLNSACALTHQHSSVKSLKWRQAVFLSQKEVHIKSLVIYSSIVGV